MKLIVLSIVQLLIIGSSLGLDKNNDCKCRIQATNRIIGGEEVPQLSYQWQVALSFIEPRERRRNSNPYYMSDSTKASFLFCGGTVINEWYILTAGHCIPNEYMKSKLMVGHGSNDLVAIYDDDKYVEVEKVIRHPDFDDKHFYYKEGFKFQYGIQDIGLIKLKKPLIFNNTTQPACLENKNYEGVVYEGELLQTGWGNIEIPKTYSYFKKSRYLKAAVAYDKSEELEICRNKNQNICVVNESTRETVCKGDSGGPLMITNAGRTKVIGIASYVGVSLNDYGTFVKTCTGEAVFTRLSYFIKWVESIVGNDYCS